MTEARNVEVRITTTSRDVQRNYTRIEFLVPTEALVANPEQFGFLRAGDRL